MAAASAPALKASLKAGDVSPAAEQPYDQNNYKDNSEYSPDAISAATAVIAPTIISEAATKEDDQQNNYQDQFHDKLPF
jgi:hypothetical protein